MAKKHKRWEKAARKAGSKPPGRKRDKGMRPSDYKRTDDSD